MVHLHVLTLNRGGSHFQDIQQPKWKCQWISIEIIYHEKFWHINVSSITIYYVSVAHNASNSQFSPKILPRKWDMILSISYVKMNNISRKSHFSQK